MGPLVEPAEQRRCDDYDRVRADEQRWLGRELNQRRHDQQVQDDAREDRRLIRSTSDGAPAQEWYAGCDQGDSGATTSMDDGLHSDEGRIGDNAGNHEDDLTRTASRTSRRCRTR